MQGYDSRRFRLDLERELDIRDPPGEFGHVTVDDTASRLTAASRRNSKAADPGEIIWGTREKTIGRALVASHQLSNVDCQCRHELTVDGERELLVLLSAPLIMMHVCWCISSFCTRVDA